jgi:hypothetical protein
MDVKGNQAPVIDFLLLEGCTGKEIVIRLRNVYGSAAYCRVSLFRRISEVCRGKEELRNEGRPEIPPRHETDAVIWSILQENSITIAKMLSITAEAVRMCPA